MLKKRKYKKRKTKVKFYYFQGLKCQGRKELRYLKECVRYKRTLPTKPKRVKTPYGFYTPDFEHPDRFIEVKCLGTFLVLYGLKTYKGLGELSTLQLEKILWVNKNIKPVHIIVYVSKNEYKPNLKDFYRENLNIKIKGGKNYKSS